MPKKGGKLKAKEVKDFLSASYDKTPPNDLDGYILDKSLSTATAKVYYNPQTNHAVVAHRGTKGTLDWGNNLAYALGAYEYTPRYRQGKSVQDKAEAKYGKSNISTLGHSQGAILARKLGTDTKEVINVNPAYMNERPAKNEYNIRSSTDVVSGLYAPVAKTREFLFPKYSEKHDITIPSLSATDVLGEHSYDILDRMGDAEIGVGAGNIFSSNNIMYNEVKAGKRYSRLGYSGEDIDWVGGGVIHTNNNCGAVGTPYVNRGTNPFGTRGAGFHDGHSSVDKYFKPPKGLRRGAGKMKGGATPQQILNLAMVLFGQDLPTNQAQTDLLDMLDLINLGLEDPANFDEANDLYGLLLNEMGWGEDWENNFIFNEIEPEELEEPISPSRTEKDKPKGGKIKNPFKKVGKSFQKGITDVGSAFGKVGETLNPMSYALKDKKTSEAMGQSGEITHDYLLPAVVSAGKPIYDATAITASTMLTGNPVLGKAVSQTLWNEMVAKRGADPRQNQKSAELGELSSTFGQAVSKPYSAALGGMGRAHRFRLKAGMEGGKRLDTNTYIEEVKEELRNEYNPLWERLNTLLQSDTLSDELEEEIMDLLDEGVDEEINLIFPGLYTEKSVSVIRQKIAKMENLLKKINSLTGGKIEKEEKPPKVLNMETERISAFEVLPEDLVEPLPEHLIRTRDRREEEMEGMRWRLRQPITDEEYQELINLLNVRMPQATPRSRSPSPQPEEAEYDFMDVEGSGRKKIDFEDIKWGSFTRMFQEFKRENPRARVKDLEAFAHRIIKNKKKFSDKAFKKAQFYLNVIKKGGAREGRERLGMAQEDIISRLAQKAEETKKQRKELVEELKSKNRTSRHERNIVKLTQHLDLLENAIKDFKKNEELIKRQVEGIKKHEKLLTAEQTKRFKKLMKKVEKLSLR